MKMGFGQEVYCFAAPPAIALYSQTIDFLRRISSRLHPGDLTEYFEKNHIGYALWNYKCLDFGLLDMKGEKCSSLF